MVKLYAHEMWKWTVQDSFCIMYVLFMFLCNLFHQVMKIVHQILVPKNGRVVFLPPFGYSDRK